MSDISYSEIFNWLDSQQDQLEIWFSKNLMQWCLRDKRIGVFFGNTFAETVCEAISINKLYQTEPVSAIPTRFFKDSPSVAEISDP